MKLVVTILQARRVVLPYLFCRYALPRMQAAFRGEVEVVLIQHRSLPAAADTFLETNQAGGEGVERVAAWTAEGRFGPAEVLAHEHHVPDYPSIPSIHLACQAALDRGADFHLWLEDDAFVLDEGCGAWPERFGRREVGVYRAFSGINSAFFVSRPGFDERVLPGLADYEAWSRAFRIEPYFQSMLRTRRVFLDPAAAVRTHRNLYPHTGPRFVAQRIREVAPQEAHLLDLELGPGASELPPVGPAEMWRLRARDWLRPKELGRRLRSRVVEAGWELAGALRPSRGGGG